MVMLREEMGKEGALLKRGAPFLWGGKAAHTLKLASPCLQGEGTTIVVEGVGTWRNEA